jgi:hypothetical protein
VQHGLPQHVVLIQDDRASFYFSLSLKSESKGAYPAYWTYQQKLTGLSLP